MGSFQLLSVVEMGPSRVKLVGELDVAGVPEVQECLARLDGDIEVDCSGLTFIDCSGLGLLIGAHHTCDARGAKLLLVDPPACMTRLLALTELDALFHLQFAGSVS
ncbi:MAG: STAS domain-containing protein [Acidimicrobiales bacterium]